MIKAKRMGREICPRGYKTTVAGACAQLQVHVQVSVHAGVHYRHSIRQQVLNDAKPVKYYTVTVSTICRINSTRYN